MLAVAWMRMLRLTRRGALPSLRYRYALLLGGEVMLLVVLASDRVDPGSWWVIAFHALAWQQAVIACLLGPAFAAGAITAERSAGTLDALLASPLEGRELITGNWLGFTLQLVLVLLPGWPIAVFLGGILGAGADAISFVMLAPLGAVPAAVAVGLLASAVMRTTSGALVLSYATLVGLALAWLSVGWVAVALAVPACLIAAALLLRPVGRRHHASAESTGSPYRPPIGHSPIRWREVWVGRRVPWWLGMACVAGVTAVGALAVGMRLVAWIGLPLGMLLLAVRASGAIAGERERRTWDETLLMPYETHEIVIDKLNGLLLGVMPLQFAFLAGCVPSLLWDAWGGAAGLLAFLVSWPALYFAAAVGLDCSARYGRSWQGLAFGLLDWAMSLAWQSFCALIPASCVAFSFVLVALAIGFRGGGVLDVFHATTVGLAISVVLVFNMWRALDGTVRWIDEHERIPQGVRPTYVDQGGLP